ncbi:TrbG/VirB9 family P-type conjugative transfer protein [Sphingomonas canadensis]|uniref:TrbG/VirB9 family P-type conjugative transfer protein n=1 Tax=Sphingomonas canadensis TaxID=1219257 RepID=A0ABW3HGK2_9SPHN|nr:TrbG/VirB9 family P-type conjugative transfer protein [Sphingomonas canadensis]MCW3838426.1 TrbG/VirB9 family P-type conjugative transfer protein [Sphingomonas canadensis]
MRLLAALIALAAPLPAAAQVVPQPGPGDPRVQSVEYNPEQVVLLRAATGYQVTIELAPDERIESIAVGDAGSWQATPNKRGDHVFVKPLQSGITTNMVVVTDTRTYAFELAPLFGPQPDMAFTLRFRYPGTAQAPAEGAATAEAAPRGRYRVTGDAAIRPSGIDDDGAKTYIEWPADATLPAVYSVDGKGKEALVNGMMRDGILVIDSVVPRLVFRLDKQVARATRVAPGKGRKRD